MNNTAPLCILLVEDDPVAARLLAQVVRQRGYAVLGPATSAAQALALVAAGPPPAAAVLDIDLPGPLDGIGLAAALQAQAPLPILFLTAHNDPAVFARAAELRPLAFLLKPIDEVVLDYALALGLLPPVAPASHRAAPLLHDSYFLHHAGHTVRLRLADIQYITAGDKYATAVTGSGSYALRITLSAAADELAPHGFVRIHRRHLLNVNYLDGLAAGNTLVLVAGQQLPLGETYRDALLRCLQLR